MENLEIEGTVGQSKLELAWSEDGTYFTVNDGEYEASVFISQDRMRELEEFVAEIQSARFRNESKARYGRRVYNDPKDFVEHRVKPARIQFIPEPRPAGAGHIKPPPAGRLNHQ